MQQAQEQLQALIDRQAIKQQITNYARSVDRLDHAVGKGVFHPEAKADYGTMFQGTGWGFIDWCLEEHLKLVSHSHQFSNITIEITGDRARSETYGDVTVRWRDERGGLHVMRNLGRYLDQWEKRDGAWRISDRKYVHDLDYTVAVEDEAYPMTGRRDSEDASYFLQARRADIASEL